MKIERLWIATLTHHNFSNGDPQTGNRVYLSIDVGGREVFRTRIKDESDGGFKRGRANLFEVRPDGLDLPLDQLDASAVRLGVEGNDAWQPSHIFVWAEGPRRILPRPYIFPLAFESNWDVTLSTDADEGSANAAVQLISRGNARMPIHRLLLITAQTRIEHTSSTAQNPEFLEGKLGIHAIAKDRLVASTMIGDTPQDATHNDATLWPDKTIVGRSNFYQPHVFLPFMKAEVGHGDISVVKRGGDNWWPNHFFLFGLDSKFGRPTRITPLCYLPDWGGLLSFDATSGEILIPLPMVDEGIELDDLQYEAFNRVG